MMVAQTQDAVLTPDETAMTIHLFHEKELTLNGYSTFSFLWLLKEVLDAFVVRLDGLGRFQELHYSLPHFLVLVPNLLSQSITARQLLKSAERQPT